MLPFVGWLRLERTAGRRRVAANSLHQYFSAARQMHLLHVGTTLPSYPLLDHVVRAYRRWEEQSFPRDEVRCGISSRDVRKMWELGMSSQSLEIIRDCAACVFAFCFNGLRESSVLSLPCTTLWFKGSSLFARCVVWKGRAASTEQMIAYHRVGRESSPTDLISRWKTMRQAHARLFTLPSEPVDWKGQDLTHGMRRVIRLLGITAPPEGKYTSHSLRIGAHTEQVMLGIPLEARLSRFAWGANSLEMAILFFDRSLKKPADSSWFSVPQ